MSWVIFIIVSQIYLLRLASPTPSRFWSLCSIGEMTLAVRDRETHSVCMAVVQQNWEWMGIDSDRQAEIKLGWACFRVGAEKHWRSTANRDPLDLFQDKVVSIARNPIQPPFVSRVNRTFHSLFGFPCCFIRDFRGFIEVSLQQIKKNAMGENIATKKIPDSLKS